MSPQDLPEDRVSLHAFLSENRDLFSTLGIMFGLAGVLGSIPSTLTKPFPLWPLILISVFSLLMMIGVMVVWSEINARFPSGAQPRLKYFRYVLTLAYWLVVLYLLLLYRNLSFIFLPVGIYFLLGLPITHWVLEIRVIRAKVIQMRNTKPGKISLFIFAAIFAGLISYLVMYLSNNINAVLNFISQIMVT